MSRRPLVWVFPSLAASLSLARAQDPVPTQAPAQETPAAAAEAPAPPAGPRAIRAEDYGRFERLGSAVLSPDGRWLAYGVSRVDEEYDLRLRMLATDETVTLEHGTSPAFSSDGSWLAYAIGPSPKEREAASEKNEPPAQRAAIRSLLTGKTDEIEGVDRFAFSEDGQYLALLRSGKGKGGRDLLVRELSTGDTTTFGHVASFSWCDEESLLATTLATEDEVGNGVQLFDPRTHVLRTLDSAKSGYTALTWRKDAADLAVLREIAHEDDEDASYEVLGWRGLGGGEVESLHLDPRQRDGFPDLRLVDFGGVRWSKDGDRLWFGVKAWDHKPAKYGAAESADSKDEAKKVESKKEGSKDEAKKDDAAAKDGAGKDGSPPLRDSLDKASRVEVWHARDIDIMPLQKKTASAREREHYLCVWWLDEDRFVQLADETVEDVTPFPSGHYALGTDHTPYERERMFGPTLEDLYVVDQRTAERRRFLTGNKYRYANDPAGERVLYLKDDQFYCYHVATDRHVRLAENSGLDFVQHDMSTLTDEKPAHGVLGWSPDGSVVYLADQFDVHAVPTDGEALRTLTKGKDRKVQYRLLELDPKAERGVVDESKVLWLSAYGDRSKQFGFAVKRPGAAVRDVVMRDENLGRLAKAQDAEVYSFVQQDFDDSPDVLVGSADLAEAHPVTTTNAFQGEFLWGHSELVEYTSAQGEVLQGSLYYPAGYEAGKQYPMITYIYEERAQSVHDYAVPTERHPYNPAVFTALGYFWFQPDIVYHRAQNPGLSAKDCVVPAVQKMIDTGMVDPKGVGLLGHSWGGYQTAFLSTQTEIFSAFVAGAPLTNMMSMSMSIYWNSGQTDAWIFHESQGRMDRPFWEDVRTYMDNSAVFHVDDLKKPLLVAFGDADGAVDWHQGIELYNAARLAGKQMVLLVYPGENHSNAQKENQVDYHYRVREWFDHYLKGAEPASWITEGRSLEEQKKEIDAVEKKSKKGGKPGKGGSAP